MGYVEKDPRDVGFIALYIAAKKWYKLIFSEQAIRIVQGKSTAKPGQKLTPELREEIKKKIYSPNFKSFDAIEKKYKISRYEIIESEELFAVARKEMLVKQLKKETQTCAGDCEKCILNTEISDGYTMCEFLDDVEIKNNGTLEMRINKHLQKTAINCNFTGETRTRGFEVYQSVLDEFNKFLDENRDKKKRDIVSAALLEYMARHNKKPGN